MKKRIIIIVGIGLVIAALAAGAIWYVVSTQVVKDGPATPTEPLSPQKQAVQVGVDAEKKGKTKDALDSYKHAKELCKDDVNCKVDMDMKIALMQAALKQEEKYKNYKPETERTKAVEGQPKADQTKE